MLEKLAMVIYSSKVSYRKVSLFINKNKTLSLHTPSIPLKEWGTKGLVLQCLLIHCTLLYDCFKNRNVHICNRCLGGLELSTCSRDT